MAMNEAVFEAQQALMHRNNIITNILGIPLIEIEQLNPRMNKLCGAMGVRYHNVGGDIDDPESEIDYEYDYVGQEIEFIQNPIPRAPLGTGRVTYLCDDELDENGKAIKVPMGSLSGEECGWNRELLASHYGEGYWRIVDPKIDSEIQDRYRKILLAKDLDDEQVDALVSDAVDRQMQGMRGSRKVTVRTNSAPVVSERQVAKAQGAEIENHPLFQALQKQNADLADKVSKLMAAKPKRTYKKRAKKKTTKKKAAAKKPAASTSGNLGG